jgi:hypothetical protein
MRLGCRIDVCLHTIDAAKVEEFQRRQDSNQAKFNLILGVRCGDHRNDSPHSCHQFTYHHFATYIA